jgi:hypothetical protein
MVVNATLVQVVSVEPARLGKANEDGVVVCLDVNEPRLKDYAILAPDAKEAMTGIMVSLATLGDEDCQALAAFWKEWLKPSR